jgi:hypothetical protein
MGAQTVLLIAFQQHDGVARFGIYELFLSLFSPHLIMDVSQPQRTKYHQIPS